MFYFDATCPWLMREFKSIEIDRYQRCNNTDDEPRNGAIETTVPRTVIELEMNFPIHLGIFRFILF